MEANTTTTERTAVNRRTALKAAVGGAAAVAVHSGPRISGFSLVPDYAMAASGDCVIPTVSGGGSWTMATSHAVTVPTYWQDDPGQSGDQLWGTLGWSGSMFEVIADPAIDMQPEPAEDNYWVTFTHPGTLALSANSTYTFSFTENWSHSSGHGVSQTVTAQYSTDGGSTWTDGFSHTTTTGSGTPTRTFDIATGGSAVNVTFRFRHTWGAGTMGNSADISVGVPSISCVNNP